MKVLINTPALDRPGGVANMFLSLRPHLDSIAVNYFTTGRRGGEGPALTALRVGVDYVRFVRAVIATKCDIVHLNPSLGPRAMWRDAFFIVLAKTLGRRTLVFMHGWNRGYEGCLGVRGRLMFRLTFLRADAFVVLASEFLRQLRSFGFHGRIYTLTTTFDGELLKFEARGRDRPSASAPFNVLFLSRVEREKGVLEALAAFAILQSEYPNAQMTVAGTGGAVDEARRFVEEHGVRRVDFPGYVRGARKAELYARSHCCLFPTRHCEGMPISVVEAMVFGLPVITCPVGALPDFFRDGEMGFLAQSCHPAVLAELLRRLLLSPALCARMGTVNREYALANFSPQAVASRMMAVYGETMQG